MADVGHLSHIQIDTVSLSKRVAARSRGGIVTFVGHVRDHQDGRPVVRLDYSAYESMADAECGRIVAEAEERWPVAAELTHRLGSLEVGDVAVAVAVGGAHREEAFAACRWIIEEVKRRVPIWKREFYADGTVGWVDPTAAPAGMGRA